MSAKLKLTLSLGVILVVSFLVVSLINYKVSRQAALDEVMNSSLPLTSENVYSEIMTDLMRPIFISSLMANDAFLKTWAMDGERGLNNITRYLTEIRDKYGFFAAFFVSAQSGRYYHPDGVLKQVSPMDDHDVWFFDFMKSGLEYDLDVDTNQAAENKLTIFINYRVESPGGKVLGVAGVGLEMDVVAELLKSYQEKYERTIYMTDPNGLVQTHTRTEFIEALNIRDVPGLGDLAEEILSPVPKPRQFTYKNDQGVTLLSVRYIPELDWYLLVEQDQDRPLASARANLMRTLLVGLAASLVIIFISLLTVNHFQARLEHMAGTDELTGVANRRLFDTQFLRAVHRKVRSNTPLTLILLDVDGLKEVNDRLGHLAGDETIRAVAEIARSQVRGEDVVARWGGDEFMILVEGGLENGKAVAERIRNGVAVADLPGRTPKSGPRPKVSVSCGVAEYESGDDLDSLTSRADKAMYQAKSQGKDAVVAG